VRTRPIAAAALAVALGCGPSASEARRPAGPAGSEPGSGAPAPARPAPDPPGGGGAAPVASGRLTDVTEAWGLDFVHDAGLTPDKHLPETMGAGAAVVDLDADGRLDVYLVQGGLLPLPGARPDPGAPTNALFLNAGGRLVDATGRSGAAADAGYGMGAAAGDVDADGDVDLLVTNLGPDRLLVNDGAARFARRAAGVEDPRWTGGAAFFDADRDGDLDLYVAAYVEVDLADPPWCGDRKPGWRSACHPDVFPGLDDRFYLNRGDGTFEVATRAAGLRDVAGKGLGVLAEDLDDDGWTDLYVANDSVENRYWRATGPARFEDATLLSGLGVNGRGLTEAGMGLACADLDRDGRLDVYVTNFDEESNTYYGHLGEGLFEDRTIVAGLEAPTRPYVGFGTVAEDLDRDGDVDLAVTNGHIIDNIHLYDDGKRHAQPGQLFLNDGSGRFLETPAAAGDLAAPLRVGRGLYPGDLDGDGDADLVLTQCGGDARLLRNDLSEMPTVRLEGVPRGARVRVEHASGRVDVLTTQPPPSYFGHGDPTPRIALADDGGLVAVSVRAGGGPWRRHRLAPPHVDPRLDLSSLPGGR